MDLWPLGNYRPTEPTPTLYEMTEKDPLNIIGHGVFMPKGCKSPIFHVSGYSWSAIHIASAELLCPAILVRLPFLIKSRGGSLR